ncbi:hypothetical protein N7535_005609 [Penicillium sp. DV-2018c]|nr:hypothetical protein N7461_009183 [Penicillium sp. DV-2018c]KAJ5571949.1 hypothetical protein N7535_005609 [Penicillium sp. DV-2018c]
MRAVFLSVFCTLLLLGTLTSAWPWGPYGAVKDRASLGRRAENIDGTTTGTSDSTATGSTASETASGTATGMNTDTNTNTGTATGTGTTTGTATGTHTGTNTGKTKTTATTSISIDPAAAAGGVSMITPGPLSTTYYKIGEDVTFVWNYTSLSVTPSAVNVVATCSLNAMKYTLTSNMTVEQTGSVVWDTGKYKASATVPLLTASYTLFVYDVDKDMGDVASAGHLGSQIGFPFSMYIPQPYTPLNEYKCATCNGALSETGQVAVKFVVGMAVITVASFTWFAGSAGVLAT